MEEAVEVEQKAMQASLNSEEMANFKANNEMRSATRRSVATILLLLAISAGIVFIFSFFLARRSSLRLTVPIEALTAIAMKMTDGHYRQVIGVTSDDEIGILAQAIQDMSNAIASRDDELETINQNLENLVEIRTQELTVAIRERLEAEKSVLKKDLELVGIVQNLLLPTQNEFHYDLTEVSAYYRPANQSGGDWWWHDRLPSGKLRTTLVDVTGHGAGPAMVTAAIASCYNVVVANNLEARPKEIFESFERVLNSLCRGEYWMTASIIELDQFSGEADWWTCGAPPLFVARSDSSVQVCDAEHSGCPLGSGVISIGHMKIQMNDQDCLFVFTDGTFEFESKRPGRQFGLRGLKKAFTDSLASETSLMCQNIGMKIEQAMLGESFPDDMTFLMIKRRSAVPLQQTA
jgi:serine phosphatase RsbU (regulator of sigma subunit)